MTTEAIAEHLRGCANDLAECIRELKKRKVSASVTWKTSEPITQYSRPSSFGVHNNYYEVTETVVKITQTETTTKEF